MKFVLREKGLEEFKRLVAEKRKSLTTLPEVFEVASPVAQPLVNIAPVSSQNGHFSENMKTGPRPI